MRIEITDHRKIFTVQKEFNELFPFLKIEFFEKPHTSAGASGNSLITQSSKTLGNCRTIHKKGYVTITPNMTVRDLHRVFSDVYGLTIQVSRASGSGWIVTTDTDGWSLEKQNSEGQQSGIVEQGVVK